PAQGGHFGSNLFVNGGTLELSNANANITLDNGVTITNYTRVDVTVANNFGGIVVAGGSSAVTIQNYGTFVKSAGGPSYEIDNPIHNGGAVSILQVNSGSLRFKGADAVTGKSVYQDGAGIISIRSGADLRVDHAVYAASGTIEGAVGGSITGDLDI